MNILYISPMVIDYDNLDGVARKLLFQCDALGSVGCNDKMYLASFFSDDYYAVRSKGYNKEIRFKNKESKQLNLFQIYPQLPVVCKELGIQAVYFRVMSLSWVTDNLFSELKRQRIKIIIEIPTYPFWKEKWMGVSDCIKKSKVLRGIERGGANVVYWIYTHKLKKYTAAIVTFSNIEKLWGIKVIGIANGYHFEIPEKAKILKGPSDELNLLIVASIRDNHGVDRVLQGLSDYYGSRGTRKIVFNIVGDGDAIPSLRELVNKLPKAKNHVIFHGFKSGSELDAIYELSDIGVSALGFHRLGVAYCSPLKSKEYFAKGLPIAGTTAEKDILSSDCREFFFASSEDDKPLEIEKLIEFYDDLKSKGITSIDIIQTASKYFDWRRIMEPIYNVLAGE